MPPPTRCRRPRRLAAALVLASSPGATATVATGSAIRRATDAGSSAIRSPHIHALARWAEQEGDEEIASGADDGPAAPLETALVEVHQLDRGVEDDEDAGPARLVRDDEPRILTELVGTFTGFAIYTAFAALYLRNRARFYPAERMVVEGGEEAFMEFRHGLFSCFERPSLSIMACCCPALRMADTVYTMGILSSFWSAFFVLALIYTSTQASMTTNLEVTEHSVGAGRSIGLKLLLLLMVQKVVDLLVFPLLGAALRGELRSKFRMKERDSGTLFRDTCTWFWCSCCAMVQEARQVEDAVCSTHPAVAQPIDTSV
eukprot:CAMPEP_0176224328 /NCGR_PEP_ID=MMETSP0121_2-20121125/21196_1 /TAXON_ID=160619 /ORGANISM="Kryptoperidinium foliaceum, Strain CCMP 1326" /LENGTH=315 /DNA_ID=CAMNT_0017563575 /DNA_START=81 /DNA_END=1028 /DNA_ORIENTATION=+